MITGLVETDEVSTTCGGAVDGGTKEIIARRSFFDTVCGRIGVFAIGGVIVDCSTYKYIQSKLSSMKYVLTRVETFTIWFRRQC